MTSISSDPAIAPARSPGWRGWLRAHPILVVLFVAAVVRIALIPPHVTEVGRGDPARFVYQAEHLLAGEGYVWRNKLCAHLPPGYPYFIAGVYSIARSNTLVIALQFVLSLASCALVYFAVRPRSERIAWIAALAMSVHLWSAYYCWQLMSECLGAFLAALLVYLVSRVGSSGEAKRRVLAACIGLVAAASVLTTPSMLILTFGVVLLLVVQNLRRPATALGVLLGFGVLMVPWQLHCQRTLGRFVPQVLDTTLHTSRGLPMWQRTWAMRTKPPHQSAWGYFLWDTPGMSIEQLPADAFRSEEERLRFKRLAVKWRATNASIPEREKEFEPVAEERIAEAPFAFYVGLPLLRSALLWLEMPNVSYAQLQYVGRWSIASDRPNAKDLGPLRAVGQALFSNFAFVLHAFFLVYFAALGVGAIASRRWMALVLVLGVVGYTCVSSYLAISEFRRNLPFVPILLFLAYYWPAAWRPWRWRRRVRAQ